MILGSKFSQLGGGPAFFYDNYLWEENTLPSNFPGRFYQCIVRNNFGVAQGNYGSSLGLNIVNSRDIDR